MWPASRVSCDRTLLYLLTLSLLLLSAAHSLPFDVAVRSESEDAQQSIPEEIHRWAQQNKGVLMYKRAAKTNDDWSFRKTHTMRTDSGKGNAIHVSIGKESVQRGEVSAIKRVIESAPPETTTTQKRRSLIMLSDDEEDVVVLERRSPNPPSVGGAMKTLQRSKSMTALTHELPDVAKAAVKAVTPSSGAAAAGSAKGARHMKQGTQVSLASSIIAAGSLIASQIQFRPPPITLHVQGRKGRAPGLGVHAGEGGISGNLGRMQFHVPTAERQYGHQISAYK